jgi:DNA repair ATPase RecN
MQPEESTETASKIRKLEERITQKLNPDLAKTVEQRRMLQEQLQDYDDLERNLQLLQQQVRHISLFFRAVACLLDAVLSRILVLPGSLKAFICTPSTVA